MHLPKRFLVPGRFPIVGGRRISTKAVVVIVAFAGSLSSGIALAGQGPSQWCSDNVGNEQHILNSPVTLNTEAGGPVGPQGWSWIVCFSPTPYGDGTPVPTGGAGWFGSTQGASGGNTWVGCGSDNNSTVLQFGCNDQVNTNLSNPTSPSVGATYSNGVNVPGVAGVQTGCSFGYTVGTGGVGCGSGGPSTRYSQWCSDGGGNEGPRLIHDPVTLDFELGSSPTNPNYVLTCYSSSPYTSSTETTGGILMLYTPSLSGTGAVCYSDGNASVRLDCNNVVSPNTSNPTAPSANASSSNGVNVLGTPINAPSVGMGVQTGCSFGYTVGTGGVGCGSGGPSTRYSQWCSDGGGNEGPRLIHDPVTLDFELGSSPTNPNYVLTCYSSSPYTSSTETTGGILMLYTPSLSGTGAVCYSDGNASVRLDCNNVVSPNTSNPTAPSANASSSNGVNVLGTPINAPSAGAGTDCHAGTVAVSTSSCANGELIGISGTGNASGGVLAVSNSGSATGTGCVWDNNGCYGYGTGISASGPTYGTAGGISGTGAAHPWWIAVSGTGDAWSTYLAVSGIGCATTAGGLAAISVAGCSNSGYAAISGLGSASGGVFGISGNNATGGNLAIGYGSATSDQVAVSVWGPASGGTASISAAGSADNRSTLPAVGGEDIATAVLTNGNEVIATGNQLSEIPLDLLDNEATSADAPVPGSLTDLTGLVDPNNLPDVYIPDPNNPPSLPNPPDPNNLLPNLPDPNNPPNLPDPNNPPNPMGVMGVPTIMMASANSAKSNSICEGQYRYSSSRMTSQFRRWVSGTPPFTFYTSSAYTDFKFAYKIWYCSRTWTMYINAWVRESRPSQQDAITGYEFPTKASLYDDYKFVTKWQSNGHVSGSDESYWRGRNYVRNFPYSHGWPDKFIADFNVSWNDPSSCGNCSYRHQKEWWWPSETYDDGWHTD